MGKEGESTRPWGGGYSASNKRGDRAATGKGQRQWIRKKLFSYSSKQSCPSDSVRDWPRPLYTKWTLRFGLYLSALVQAGARCGWSSRKRGCSLCILCNKSQFTFLQGLFSACGLAEFRASWTSTPLLPIPVRISTHPLHCMKSKWQTYGQQSIFIPSLLPADMFNMLKLHLRDCIESVSCLYLMYGRTLYIAPNVEQTVT